jgi:hypothetical protein
MIQVFISHKCSGDDWVASWDDQSPDGVPATFKNAGIEVIGRFRGIADPNITGLLVQAESMEAFGGFAAASEDNPNFLKLGVDLSTLTYLGNID